MLMRLTNEVWWHRLHASYMLCNARVTFPQAIELGRAVALQDTARISLHREFCRSI